MKIAGLVKSSLIDYPGNVAAVVFTQGCNFRCGFCHNPDLIAVNQVTSKPGDQLADGTGDLFPEADLLGFLEKRRGLLDGVVITGGEPMVQADLLQFMKKLKRMGFLVKLDTNGSNPAALRKAIAAGLADYIAMDIKGPLGNYSKICGFSNTRLVRESIDIIMKSGVPYEFRTTVLPHFHKLTDFREIGELIKGATRYTVQGFRPNITFDKALGNEKSFTRAELEEIADVMRRYVTEVVIHDNI